MFAFFQAKQGLWNTPASNILSQGAMKGLILDELPPGDFRWDLVPSLRRQMQQQQLLARSFVSCMCKRS
jgi:hypothetical protein